MDINTQLTEAGFSIESKLLRDDFNPEKAEGSHTHLVTVYYKGKSLECEFTSGCAHRHYRGRPARPIKIPYGRMCLCDIEDLARSIPNEPELADVLYSILMDSNVGRYGECFEDFCANYGFGEDSRKAFRIYEACLNMCGKLRKLGADLEWLDELFQDY